MATQPNPTPSQIPGFDTQIGNLQTQADSYQSRLSGSPTAFSAATPSSSDISNQQTLAKIQTSITALQDKKLKAQWYPPTQQGAATDIGTGNDVNPGTIGSTLDWLGRPVRGIVGAVKHFTGQGTGSLTNDVANNMMVDKQYFGDVLSKAGVPGWVAAPLGFGLDIALDPVNWATMGEAALIPKLAGGLVRGGAEGLSAAGKAGVLEKAVTVGQFTPWFKKSELFSTLKENTFAATSKYENITGQTLENILQKGGGIGNPFGDRIPLSEIINKVADITPGGQAVLKTLIYDPVDWVKQTVDMDIIKRAFGTEGVADVRGAVNARIKDPNAPIDEFMKPVRETVESTPVGPAPTDAAMNTMTDKEIDTAMAAIQSDSVKERVQAASAKMAAMADDTKTISDTPSIGVTGDALTNGLRILNETGYMGGNLTLEDVAAVVNSGALGDTGVKWFDNFMQSIKDFRSTVDENNVRIGGIGEKTLGYYDRFMALFRGAKVGGSPVGHMNALFGNAIMNHLGVGDIGPEYWATYKRVYDMYAGVPGSAAKLQGMLQDAGVFDQVASEMRRMSTAARGTFGEMPQWMDAQAQAKMLYQNLVSEAGKVAGIDTTGMTEEAISKYLGPIMQDLKNKQASLMKMPDLSGTATVRAMKMSETASRLETPTDIVSQEMFDQPVAREMFKHIADMAAANPGNLGWKALDIVYNKMSNQYAKWDQISKMTTFLRSTMSGYTKEQIMRARNLINISAEDITAVTHDASGKALGITKYRLSSLKGLELSNALYMNYAAMPSAVRVLRNMPLVGSPFISFMYGMALKTGQTLAYNPAAFNKVEFALDEFSGKKSPLEKQALNTPFYSYLKQPGMYRTPFFDSSPIYINLSNMIPYYSMNMFNPSTQQYSAADVQASPIATSLSQFVASSPFLKEPLGAILFNNLIQPAILSEGVQPQGQFGQPIWPADADFLTKLGYSARDLTESVIPGVASFSGLAGGLVAPDATPFVPLYRYRNLANAVHGKNVYGITGKEPAASRTTRGILSGFGIPVQAPVNMTFTPGQ